MKKILVLGSNGILGSYLYSYLKSVKGFEVFGLSRTDKGRSEFLGDATNKNFLVSVISKVRPDVVINAIKHRGSTSDTEKGPKDKIFLVNSILPKFLAELSKTFHYHNIFISSVWVYPGEKDVLYSEDSIPYPKNFYAFTKYVGELYTSLLSNKKYSILRTEGIFGFEDPPLNFLARMLAALKSGNDFYASQDQCSNPISALELSKIIHLIIEKEIFGLYNVTGPEYLSRFELAKIFSRFFNLPTEKIKPSSVRNRKVLVPKYVKTSNEKISKRLNYKIKNIHEQLLELNSWNGISIQF